MDDNNQYDELLVRYLLDDVDLDKKIFVENWIRESDQNSIYFEELKAVWNLTVLKETVDKVTIEDEWDKFRQNIARESDGMQPRDQLPEKSFEGDERQSRSIVYRILLPSAIAASVLLIVGFGWKYFSHNKNEPPIATNAEKKVEAVKFVVHNEVNTTGKEKRITLIDGSIVVLANNSEITYREPFIDRRDIALVGKAYFKVKHDDTKPFVVTSGDITTTDIGTEFTVTAFTNTHQVIVRLYKGEVVVKAVNEARARLQKDIFLLPGQEFVYTEKKVAQVKSFTIINAEPEGILGIEKETDEPLVPTSVDTPFFMFNNQSLENVLNDLAALYSVKIIYDKNEIQNTYFTGKYNKSESLENILKRICILNNLTITKKDSAFIIRK